MRASQSAMLCIHLNGKGVGQMKHRIQKFIYQLHIAAKRGFAWIDYLREDSVVDFRLDSSEKL